MTLTASHRDLDLDVLEQLGSGAGSVASTVVADSPEITGCIVLATCNRFELYLDVADGGPVGSAVAGPAVSPAADDAARLGEAASVATDVVARLGGMDPERIATLLRPVIGPDVARHLFAVASGLDSMVVGEREVAGQVRRALRAARADGTTSSVLERLFQAASGTARAVGSRTGLAGRGRSVVGVALDLAGTALAGPLSAGTGPAGLAATTGPTPSDGPEQPGDRSGGREPGLAHGRALLIGTGSYAGATVSALRARGVASIAVYSPSGRAEAFAADRGLTPVPADGLVRAMGEAELVVCCSGTRGPAIDAAMVREARHATAPSGRPRPLVLVDLALRHDVAPDVADVPGVHLIDLAVVQQHAPEVTPALQEGYAVVAERAAEFEAELAERSLAPAVVALREHVGRVLEAEVARLRVARRRAGASDETDASDLTERSLRRFAATILHTPAVRAREHARAGTDQAYRDALASLFDLHVP